MLILAAELQPGDSGSALIDPDGDVVGVVFAIALDRPGVAYALAMSELEAVLAGDLSQPVDTGPCLEAARTGAALGTCGGRERVELASDAGRGWRWRRRG